MAVRHVSKRRSRQDERCPLPSLGLCPGAPHPMGPFTIVMTSSRATAPLPPSRCYLLVPRCICLQAPPTNEPHIPQQHSTRLIQAKGTLQPLIPSRARNQPPDRANHLTCIDKLLQPLFQRTTARLNHRRESTSSPQTGRRSILSSDERQRTKNFRRRTRHIDRFIPRTRPWPWVPKIHNY